MKPELTRLKTCEKRPTAGWISRYPSAQFLFPGSRFEAIRLIRERPLAGWKHCSLTLCAFVLALALAPSGLYGQDYATDKPPPAPSISIPLTAEQTAALQAVDIRIAGVEALTAKINDTDYKATAVVAVQDLKRRRASLEKNFDPALYETLMHSVISRYQVVALWLTPPRVLPPADRPDAGKPVADKPAVGAKKASEPKTAPP